MTPGDRQTILELVEAILAICEGKNTEARDWTVSALRRIEERLGVTDEPTQDRT